jgi:hypothetical protein
LPFPNLCRWVLPSLSLFAAGAGAQALPAASREPIDVGAAFSFGSPGYQDTPTYVEGLTLFATAGLRGRLAAQLDVHLDSLITPVDIGENTYLLGPRFSIFKEERANIYVKVQGGLGQFQYQSGSYAIPRSFTYGIFSGGAGIEYRVSRHVDVRAIELEFQDWPGFPGGSLHPVVASIGAAWRL